jgi:hypothetical protein
MKKIKGIILLIVIAFLFFYFGLPVINYGFISLPIILLVITILALIFATGIQISNDAKQVKILKKPSKIYYIICGLLLFYIIVFHYLQVFDVLGSHKKI